MGNVCKAQVGILASCCLDSGWLFGQLLVSGLSGKAWLASLTAVIRGSRLLTFGMFLRIWLCDNKFLISCLLVRF